MKPKSALLQSHIRFTILNLPTNSNETNGAACIQEWQIHPGKFGEQVLQRRNSRDDFTARDIQKI
jgi:hypothetical protein